MMNPVDSKADRRTNVGIIKAALTRGFMLNSPSKATTKVTDFGDHFSELKESTGPSIRRKSKGFLLCHEPLTSGI